MTDLGNQKRQVLFCHDHTFLTDGSGNVYSCGSYPASYWSRYLEYSKKVVVVARNAEADSTACDRYALSKSAGVRFHFVERLNPLWRLGIYKNRTAKEIEKVVLESDHVVARLPSELGLLAAQLATVHRRPYSVELVGCPRDAYRFRGGRLSKMYSHLAAWRVKRAVKKAAAALYVAQFLQKRYPSIASTQTVCTNAVIDTVASGNQLASRKARLERITIEQDRLRVGLIGSFSTRYKGIDVAIRALAHLRESGINAELRILGEGDQSLYVDLAERWEVGRYLHFDGVVPAGKPVSDWLAKCDIYIQPSLTEGLPRGLLEAMAVGLPAAASTAGGIPELLPECVLHRPGDCKSLCRSVISIIEAGGEPFMTNNLETVKAFSHEVVERRRRAYYKKVLHNDGADHLPD